MVSEDRESDIYQSLLDADSEDVVVPGMGRLLPEDLDRDLRGWAAPRSYLCRIEVYFTRPATRVGAVVGSNPPRTIRQE
jgi:hypothetical protein